MHRRLIILFTVFLMSFCGLMVSVLTLASKESYAAAAASQHVFRLTVCRTRGTIYDRGLRTLAGGVRRYRACIAPCPAVKQRLRRLMEDDDFFAIESALDCGTPFVLPVEDGSLDGPGVTVLPARIRAVTAARHTVGTLGPDGRGASGIEYAYDRFLSRQDGELTAAYTVAADGGAPYSAAPDVFDSTRYSDAGVVLTVDLDIQLAVEETAARRLERGAVIVMELPRGEVRACVSLPDYSPDDMASALTAEHSPLLNRTLCAYDAGSVFKLVTAAAALEQGISPERRYVCEGSVRVGDNVFRCSSRETHGDIDMTDALAMSCNTYFIDLAREVGGEAILRQARALGFGTELRLADGYFTRAGVLPGERTLRDPAALANLSFGQGELLVTPFHIARLVGTIALGGVTVHPSLYAGRVDMNGRYLDRAEPVEGARVMSEQTADTLRRAMIKAVTDGTGKKGASMYVSSAAKTGTAQTGIRENGRYILQAWYVGFFPADDPRYVCVVLAEDGTSGGGTAGPVFSDIAGLLAGGAYDTVDPGNGMT